MKRGGSKQGSGRKHGGGRPAGESDQREVDAGAGEAGAGEKERPADDLAALREQASRAEEYYDRLLRLKAEFENFKKRTQREKAEWISRANQELMLELLPAIDSFELGLQSAEKTGDIHKLIEGLKLALGALLQVLGKFGLDSVEAEGKEFDPNFHEAVTLVDSDAHRDDTIVDEIRKGYLLHDKLLRPAMVTVARSGKEPAPEGGEYAGPEGEGKDKDKGRHG